MIIKIVGNDLTNDNNMSKITKYDYIYYKNTLYVTDNKLTPSKLLDKIRQIFSDNCYCSEVTEDEVNMEPIQVKQWCYKIWNIQKKKEYLKEQQKQLRAIMNKLEELENEIFNTGGETHARATKEKER